MSVIRSELEVRLQAMANSYVPPLPIAWEAVGFTKIPTVAFLECFLVPSSTTNVTVDGTRKRQRGMFMVNVWVPTENKGRKRSEDIVDAVIKAFPIVPKTGTVSIEQTPNASKPIPDPSGWDITPITITYRYES